ncbi:MAG: 30S ribosomal protein S19e [Thermoplasmata archaeon]
MTLVYDVPPDELLKRLSNYLKTEAKISPPAWSDYVKTGPHKERAPFQEDWWWIRSASVMRKLYLKSYIGVSRLAAEYGGKRDRGSKPYHAVKGSRSILSEILKELEAKGLVTKYRNKGRTLTKEGKDLINKLSKEILVEMVNKNPDLKIYME